MHSFIRFNHSKHPFRFSPAVISGVSGRSRACSKTSYGFTLVEVMMAVFVLAVALTGMMRLHLSALRTQRQSSYQTTAVMLAGDMAEIIRAWAAPGVDAPFIFDYRAGEARPAGADCLGGTACDPDALRRFGVAQWLDTVEAALPTARVSVCRDAAPWSEHGFRWACSGGNAGIVIKLGWRRETDGNGLPSSSTSPPPDRPRFVLNIGETKP